jgi:cytoskeletal protein RodZ
MPTLVRFLVVLIVLAAIGIAGMFYLANFVQPHTREMIVKVPADRLQAKEVVPPAAAVAAAPASTDSGETPAEAMPAAAAAAPATPAAAPPAQPTSRFRRKRFNH